MDLIYLTLIFATLFPQIIFGQHFEQWHSFSIIPKFDIEIYPNFEHHSGYHAGSGYYHDGGYYHGYHNGGGGGYYDSGRYYHSGGPIPVTHPQQQFWQYNTGPTYHQDSSGTRAISYANVQVTQHHHQHFTVIHAYAYASVTISFPDT